MPHLLCTLVIWWIEKRCLNCPKIFRVKETSNIDLHRLVKDKRIFDIQSAEECGVTQSQLLWCQLNNIEINTQKNFKWNWKSNQKNEMSTSLIDDNLIKIMFTISDNLYTEKHPLSQLIYVSRLMGWQNSKLFLLRFWLPIFFLISFNDDWLFLRSYRVLNAN